MAILNSLNNITAVDKSLFKMIENYIYLYHLGIYIVLPTFADNIQDNLPVSFVQSSILSRSAPIYSYQNSGPRTVQLSLTLHRDMMTQINKDVSNVNLQVGDDYVDFLIKAIQAVTLPNYEAASKAVNPPIVALRMGTDVFIKGVITGSLGIVYNYPILDDGKYAVVNLSLTIAEIDPYDANMVLSTGSYRNVSVTLERTSIDNLDLISDDSTLLSSTASNLAYTAGKNMAQRVVDKIKQIQSS